MNVLMLNYLTTTICIKFLAKSSQFMRFSFLYLLKKWRKVRDICSVCDEHFTDRCNIGYHGTVGIPKIGYGLSYNMYDNYVGNTVYFLN